MLLKLAVIICSAVFLGILWESPAARNQFIREVHRARLLINKTANQYEGWQLIAASIGITLLAYKIKLFLCDEEKSLWQRLKIATFKAIRSVPFVKNKIKTEMAKARKLIEKSFIAPNPGELYHLALPEKGLSYDELMVVLDNIDKLETIDWKKGYTSGCTYNCNEHLTKVASDVYGRYCWTNPLHPDVFPQVRKMEAEVIQWTVNLFNGGPEACGCLTSGGTESIVMAMKAYREVGYSKGIKFPEIICSKATHPAFDKAADLLRMKITHVPCDPLTRKVNLRAMSRAIGSNTVVLVASAPHFPHGIIDPVEEIAKLARKHRVGVHVDSCLGGFLVPFMERAGFPLDPFDFRVEGVTSISADTHKYGFSPKGSSVVLYASKELRRRQYFVCTDWEGGIYASPSIPGSRPGAIIAATWATMMSMGIEGYVDSTRAIVSTTRWIAKELEATPHIYVLGNPLVCVVGFGSKDFNIYYLNDAMVERGWSLSVLQFPSSLHIAVTALHTHEGVAQRFIDDIREGVKEIMKRPKQEKPTGSAAMYGTSQAVIDRSIISDVGACFVDVCLTASPPSDITK